MVATILVILASSFWRRHFGLVFGLVFGAVAQPMTVDVIVNRNAHRLAADTAVRRALLAAAARGGARVCETKTLSELERLACAIAARGTDGVVLAGGDGSHMAGVSALSRAFAGALPPVALAPGGTVCTVARNFGMRGTASAWTNRLVLAACTGAARVERKATLRVRDDTGGERVGFIFGAGLVARFFDVYYGSPRQGIAAAAGIAARVFAGSFVGSPLAGRVLDPTPCAVSVDGALHEWRGWSLVLASVVRDVGMHLLATYQAGQALDRFHVVASGLRPRRLGPQMLRVLAGRPLRGEPHIDTLARSMRLHFDAPSGAYVLDGDIVRAQEAQVDLGPPLALLVP
jgi:diacylglycerol kinase (ATP)